MYRIGLKMLLGSPVKYLGLIFGIAFSTFLMAQQINILFNLLTRLVSQIDGITEADIWVMHPQVQYLDEVTPLPDRALYMTRSVEGVEWAVPFYKGITVARTAGGLMKQVMLLGVDDATLVGQPKRMIYGEWTDLRMPQAMIMDFAGWNFIWPDEPFEPGRTLELNENRMTIVGLCETFPPFFTYPVVYARYTEAIRLSPQGRNSLSFVLAKAAPGYDRKKVVQAIAQRPDLKALDREDFKSASIRYYLRRTGFIINFSITVTLGFLVGTVIVALTFYLFVMENLRQFGVFKAIGVSNRQIVTIVLSQALFVAILGFCIGIGMVAIFFHMAANTESLRGFYLFPSVPLITFIAVLGIITLSSFLSMKKLYQLEPMEIFR